MSGNPPPVPKPRNLSSSSTEENKTIDSSMRALKINDDQQSTEVHRLQTVIHELKQEEEGLIHLIASLKQEEEQIRHTDLSALKAKDQKLSEREQDLSMRESRMNSLFSDRESELRQKERELQHLEDQLHMKSKDLKQKEFDIMNADSPADLNGSQLAELADRQYELDRREEELKYKEERMREWSMNLHAKESECRKRFEDLLQREAYFYSKSNSAYSEPIPNPAEQYSPATQQHQQQFAPAPQRQVNVQSPPGTVSQTPSAQQYTSQANRGYAQHHHVPDHYPGEQTDRGSIQQHPFASSASDVADRHHTHADSYAIRPTNDSFSQDLELAKKLMEEEERNFTKIIYTDEMLALTLQKEEMDDRLAPTDQSEGAASLIKKELDERLTEEQRRKKQEEEDFLMAQRLSSGADDVEQS